MAKQNSAQSNAVESRGPSRKKLTRPLSVGKGKANSFYSRFMSMQPNHPSLLSAPPILTPSTGRSNFVVTPASTNRSYSRNLLDPMGLEIDVSIVKRLQPKENLQGVSLMPHAKTPTTPEEAVEEKNTELDAFPKSNICSTQTEMSQPIQTTLNIKALETQTARTTSQRTSSTRLVPHAAYQPQRHADHASSPPASHTRNENKDVDDDPDRIDLEDIEGQKRTAEPKQSVHVMQLQHLLKDPYLVGIPKGGQFAIRKKTYTIGLKKRSASSTSDATGLPLRGIRVNIGAPNSPLSKTR